MLKEMGIKTMGDILAILKLTKEPSVPPASHIRLLTKKLPQLNSEMTSQHFRKFRIDWKIFTKTTNLQLYNCASKAIQSSIIKTYRLSIPSLAST